MALTARSPGRAAAVLTVLAVVFVIANIAVERARIVVDLTAERSSTLSEASREVLEELDRRVRITAFFGHQAPGRVEAATLLDRYRRENRRVSWRILDPALHPGELRRLGDPLPGSAAVETLEGEPRTEIAQFTIEIDLTSAIARIVRDAGGHVCFSTGHGERDPDDRGPQGLSRAADLLRDNGYTVGTVELLTRPSVPGACDAVVVAAATVPFGAAATDAITGWLAGGGAALVLGDPGAADPTPLTRAWGIFFVPGIVVEDDPADRMRDDPFAPVIRRYSAANPAVRGLGPTFSPGISAVVVEPPDDPGLEVAEVAVASERSGVLRETAEGFEPDPDIPAPVAVGAAADGSTVVDAAILRTRILAWGDVDLASNAFVGEAANARFVVQAVDWLTQPEPLIAAVPAFPQVRELELTEARSSYLLFLTAGVVPALFLIAGAFVWLVRRSL